MKMEASSEVPLSPLISSSDSPSSSSSSTSCSASSCSTSSSVSTEKWTWEEDKLFEAALANEEGEGEGGGANRWERIAASVKGKSAVAVKRHYRLLVQDVGGIEAGFISLPPYSTDRQTTNSSGADPRRNEQTRLNGGGGSGLAFGGSVAKSSSSKSAEQERKKGIPWTEEEHRLFLLGLEKYGKGDWRSISRNFVVSRTPTQVASHAQKYFIRLNSSKERRRSSIHDITSINNQAEGSKSGQGGVPITGQGMMGQPAMMPAVAAQGAIYQGMPFVPGPTMGSPVGMPPYPMPPGGPYLARDHQHLLIRPIVPVGGVPIAYPAIPSLPALQPSTEAPSQH